MNWNTNTHGFTECQKESTVEGWALEETLILLSWSSENIMKWGKENISLKNGENDLWNAILSVWRGHGDSQQRFVPGTVSTEVTSAKRSAMEEKETCSLSCTADRLTTRGFGRRKGVLISCLPTDETTRLWWCLSCNFYCYDKTPSKVTFTCMRVLPMCLSVCLVNAWCPQKLEQGQS